MMSRGRGLLLALLTLGVAVVGANALALDPILSDVADDLGASPAQVLRANAAYGGATALSALLLGGLIDRIGPVRALAGGLAVLALAMLGSGAATGWVTLALAQGVAGLASGVVLPATYALATLAAEPGREARTLGRVLTGWSVSLVAGVPLSALIASVSSWRASYLLFGGLLGLAAIALGRVPRPEREPAAPVQGGAYAGLLRRPEVGRLLAVCLMFMTAFYGVYGVLGDHLRHRLGLGAGGASLVVLAYGLGFGVAMAGDPLVDRLGPRRLFPLVLALVAAVYAVMIPATASLAGALALAAAWGFINHFGLSILVLRLTQLCPDRRGAVLALNSATTYAGALLGAAGSAALYGPATFAAVPGTAAGLLALAALVAGWPPRPALGSSPAPPA